jgi:hypothetical protein
LAAFAVLVVVMIGGAIFAGFKARPAPVRLLLEASASMAPR